MTLNKLILPIGALAIVLSAGGLSAEAGQRGDNRERSGENRGQARPRSGNSVDRDAGREQRGSARPSRDDQRDHGNPARLRMPGATSAATPATTRAIAGTTSACGRRSATTTATARRASSAARSTRTITARAGTERVLRDGSGYRYGSPYSGRVYGYSRGRRARMAAGVTSVTCGSIVRPRGAAVYVDGYYAGIVDDFDGVFQRLTLDVGPHKIEIEANGFEPQVFDVYVDPSRTVDLHGDLYPDRP